MYSIQLQSKSKVGYSTGKAASRHTIHPSKERRCSDAEASHSLSNPTALNTNEEEIEEYNYGEDDRVDQNDNDSDAISTRLVAKICKQLSEEGIDIPAPSQQDIYKALFKKAVGMKKYLIDTICNQKRTLHFDGKHIDGNEYQVVVNKNETSQIKLAAMKLCDGRAEIIAEGL
ncbi:Hypothetical predicted protein [Octopus vulgaris]|uniref:Uncharacterized protein n=1 Tax=Octopus vulgaris TaxID=6645 RepID=A0AA36B5P1_OCTVU|nr:Hypothetical predicted protein [Octopus vulgaris]